MIISLFIIMLVRITPSVVNRCPQIIPNHKISS